MSGEGLQNPVRTPRLAAEQLSSERHFGGTEMQSPEKEVLW